MSVKPVEDMTLEEIQAERLRIAAERAELAEAQADATPTSTADDAPSDAEKSAPWPHDRMTYAGMELEVRYPAETALLAVSMASVGGFTPGVQMNVFTTFLRHHLSTDSFTAVVMALTDPDSDMDIQGLITALAEAREAE